MAKSQPDVVRELRRFSFAVVYPKITEDERLLADTAVNRRLTGRIFDKLEEVVAWLVQQ